MIFFMTINLNENDEFVSNKNSQELTSEEKGEEQQGEKGKSPIGTPIGHKIDITV